MVRGNCLMLRKQSTCDVLRAGGEQTDTHTHELENYNIDNNGYCN